MAGKYTSVVYISGAYRPVGVWRKIPIVRSLITLWNILKARKVAIRYWKSGKVALCPHLNTLLFDGHCEDNAWLKGDISLIRRLRPDRDAIVMLRGWTHSEGAVAELAAAQRRGIKVIFDEG